MRITLDTNVWSRLCERDEVVRFEALESDRALRVVIPPSTLLEALRTHDPRHRGRIVAAIASRARTRIHLSTEARLEANEVIAEISRLRPNWLRKAPDPGALRGLDEFWTKRVYQRARRSPESFPHQDDATGNAVHEIQLENQQRARDSGFDVTQGEPWIELDESLVPEALGWDGSRVMAWRFEQSHLWWFQLTQLPRRRRLIGRVTINFDTTYFDWMNPIVNPAVIGRDREDWNRFWYSEVDQLALPRCWIRVVLPYAQLAWKLGKGEPRDAQHASYLYDTDVFITADRRLAWALELVRKWTKTPFATVLLLKVPRPEEGSIVNAIEQLLADVKRGASTP